MTAAAVALKKVYAPASIAPNKSNTRYSSVICRAQQACWRLCHPRHGMGQCKQTSAHPRLYWMLGRAAGKSVSHRERRLDQPNGPMRGNACALLSSNLHGMAVAWKEWVLFARLLRVTWALVS